MEITFCDLRAKEVINICDGKRLGNIIDIVFDSCCARITGIVVPGERNFFCFFKNCVDIFIPFNIFRKIGRDVILVVLNPANAPQVNTLNTTQTNEEHKEISNEYMPEIVENLETKPKPEKTYGSYEN